MMINRKGQNISEYAIIIGLIGSALLMMSAYFQRGIQSVIKAPIDNLGGFGRTDIFTPQRIQEMGIEDKVVINDGKPAEPIPSQSTSSFSATNKITTSTGAGRRLDVDESTKVSSETKTYQQVKYDQVSR